MCGDGLQGTYFTFLDKLVCEKDYKVREGDGRSFISFHFQLVQKTCSACGCLISDVYYTLEDGRVVCERDYKV